MIVDEVAGLVQRHLGEFSAVNALDDGAQPPPISIPIALGPFPDDWFTSRIRVSKLAKRKPWSEQPSRLVNSVITSPGSQKESSSACLRPLSA